MDKVSNLIALAEDEFKAENYQEADSLATDALKEDRDREDAWIIKAKAAYYLKKGLKSSYQYLSNALKASKGNSKNVLETFKEVSFKELRWDFSNALERLPDNDYINDFRDTLNVFLREGDTLLSSIKDKDSVLNSTKNEFIKYAVNEINKKWKDVAKEYYKDALSSYGKVWFDDNDYARNKYRPNEHDYNTFTESANLLLNLSRDVISLQNEECDYDSLIKLIEQCSLIIDCIVYAVAFSTGYEAYDPSEYKEEYYSEGGEYYWEISMSIGDDLKAKLHKLSSELGRDEAVLKNNKKTSRIKKKQKEMEGYWSTHQDEAAKLLAEKDAATAHKIELEKEYAKKQKELDAISSSEHDDKEEQAKRHALGKELDKKQKELKALGLFKVKEKKALKEEIDKLNSELNTVECYINRHKNDFKEEKEKKVSAKQGELFLLSKDIKKCNDVITSIDKKLLGE